MKKHVQIIFRWPDRSYKYVSTIITNNNYRLYQASTALEEPVPLYILFPQTRTFQNGFLVIPRG